jgi:hypothetical protein
MNRHPKNRGIELLILIVSTALEIEDLLRHLPGF